MLRWFPPQSHVKAENMRHAPSHQWPTIRDVASAAGSVGFPMRDVLPFTGHRNGAICYLVRNSSDVLPQTCRQELRAAVTQCNAMVLDIRIQFSIFLQMP
jgi:hypothetical protein